MIISFAILAQALILILSRPPLPASEVGEEKGKEGEAWPGIIGQNGRCTPVEKGGET